MSTINYRDVIPHENPAGYWMLADAVNPTVVADASGNERDGSWHGSNDGAPQFDGAPIVADTAAATQFTEAHIYYQSTWAQINVVASALAGKTEYTIEAWVNADAFSIEQNVIVALNKSNGDNRLLFYAPSGRLKIYSDDGGGFSSPSADALIIGQDYLVHFSRTANGGVLSINGVDVATGAAFAVTPATSDRYSIGQEFDSGAVSDFWRGRQSDVTIYDYALNTAQRADHYRLGTAPITIAILAPAADAIVFGVSECAVSDPGLASITGLFYLDAAPIGPVLDAVNGWSITLDTSAYSNGAHSLALKLFTAGGGEFFSTAQDILIQNFSGDVSELPLAFAPDWSRGMTERLEWLTDVEEAEDGSEARTPLRETPRRTFEFDALLDAKAARALELALAKEGAGAWALPIWPDGQALTAPLAAGTETIPCATAGRDFAVLAFAVVMGNDPTRAEIRRVSAVGANNIALDAGLTRAWPAGTRIYPARRALLTEWPKLSRLSGQTVQASFSVALNDISEWPETAPAASWRGLAVLELTPDWGGAAPTVQYGRQAVSVDNQLGLATTHDRTGLAWTQQGFNWFLAGREAHTAQRSLLYWLAGRAQAAWLPSYAADLTLAVDIAAAATIISVAPCGLSAWQGARKYLRLALADGTVFYREVTGVSAGAAAEFVTLDSALGRAVAVGEMRLMSWMMPARLSADSVEIAHVTDADGLARCAVTFVATPKEISA